MSTAATVLLAATAWAGALIGSRVAEATPHTLTATTIAFLLSAVLLLLGLVCGGVARTPADQRRRPVAAWLMAAAVLVLLVSAAGAAVRTAKVVAGPLASAVAALDADAPGVTVRLRARIVGDATTWESGTWSALATVDAVRSADSTVWTRSGERVRLRGPPPAPPFGSAVMASALTAPVRGDAVPWLRSLGVVVEVRAVEISVVRPPPGWVALTNGLRQRLREAVVVRLPTAQASLLTGLVTGDVDDQPAALREAFRRSGLSHLVAVSGSNVALVVAGGTVLLLALGVSRRPALGVAVVLVWWFVVLVRAEPSVVRAALVATLVLAAMLVGRLRDPRHLLAVAVLLAILSDPLLVGRLGFSLSVAAAAGVLTFGPPLRARLPGPSGLRAVVAATVGAQAAVAPVLLLTGLPVGAAGLPANVVAVPAAAVASLIGAATALLSVWSTAAAGLLASAARPALAVILWSARTFAGPAGAAVDRAAPWLIGAIAMIWAVRHWAPRGPTGVRLRRAVTVAVLLSISWVTLVGSAATSRFPATPVLVALDVGQGDALLVGDPAGGWMLVDGGPDPAVLQAGLRRHGVGALETVVVTHPHDDHDGGLIGLFDLTEVGTLVLGPALGPPEDEPIVAEAEVADVSVARVHAGMTWQLGSTTIEVLSPPAGGIDHDPNESSVVLRVTTATGRRALLAGDAEAVAQSVLLRTPGLLDVDVLKVPHHGGDTNAEGFLAATTPDVAVISAGAGNPFGHPHPDVLTELVGVEVRRTDRQGDVVVPLGVP